MYDKVYEARYGRDTPEEEVEAILEDFFIESAEVSNLIGLSTALTEMSDGLDDLDDDDQRAPKRFIRELVERESLENRFSDPVDFANNHELAEGIIAKTFRTAGQVLVTVFKIAAFTIRRGSIFISRLSKDAAAIETRLEKLDGLMRKRKTEDKRILVSRGDLVLLIEEYDLNRTPSSSISSFLSATATVVDAYNAFIKAAVSKATTLLMDKGTPVFDLKDFEEIEADLDSKLESLDDSDNLLIGNRYFKYMKDSKIAKRLVLTTGRPDAKSIVAKIKSIESLTNADIESQRSSYRSGPLKKLYALFNDTQAIYADVVEFERMVKSKESKDVTKLSDEDKHKLAKYLNEVVKESTEATMGHVMAAYKTMNAGLVLLEESAAQD